MIVPIGEIRPHYISGLGPLWGTVFQPGIITIPPGRGDRVTGSRPKGVMQFEQDI